MAPPVFPMPRNTPPPFWALFSVMVLLVKETVPAVPEGAYDSAYTPPAYRFGAEFPKIMLFIMVTVPAVPEVDSDTA